MTMPQSALSDCDLEVGSRPRTTQNAMPKQRPQRRNPEIPRRSRRHAGDENMTVNSNSKKVELSSSQLPDDERAIDLITESSDTRLSILTIARPTFQTSRTSNELIASVRKEGEASLDDEYLNSESSDHEIQGQVPEFSKENSPSKLPSEAVSTASLPSTSETSTVLEQVGSDRSESKANPIESSLNQSCRPAGSSRFQQAEGVEILLNQLTETTEKLEKSNSHCQELASQVKQLQKDLQDAHDFIFALQPRLPVITPAQASEDFKTLCLNVANWVQTTLGDVLDERRIPLSRNVSAERVEMFFSVISPSGRSAFTTPDSDEYNIIAAIMNFLCREIFNRSFWCPMEDGSLNMLDSIENSMRNLEPRRDFATVRAWRSETLVALVNRRGFLTRAQQQVDSLTNDLMSVLRVFVPRADENELFESLKAIVEPTTVLAHKFHVSVDKFDVEWTGLNPKNVDGCDITRYECQNLLPPGRILKFPDAQLEAHIVYVMDVLPGLSHHVVKADGYGEPQALNKPKILVARTKWEDGVYKYPPIGDGEHATLLGWLDENRPKEKQYMSWL